MVPTQFLGNCIDKESEYLFHLHLDGFFDCLEIFMWQKSDEQSPSSSYIKSLQLTCDLPIFRGTLCLCY